VSDSESSYSSSSEDVSEDEFGEELTPALDAAILQTLGKIKRREGVYSGENVLQEALKEAEAKAGSMGVKALQRAVAEKVRPVCGGTVGRG
jgi:protein KRI1